MKKLSINNLDISGKKILLRVDFNTPLNEKLEITDDKRIVAALPTIKKIIEGNGKLILMSHLGRPKGKVVPKMSLKPISIRLSALLNRDVTFLDDCIGDNVTSVINEMKNGDIVLLENLRFHEEETAGDEEFAKELAKNGDILVNDAFGAAHRAHASVSVLAKYFKQVAAGYLMKKEIDYIGHTMENPQRPFATILAGVKIAGKIDVIYKFLDIADKIFIAGGIANTMLLAQGYEIGNSVVEKDKIDVAKEILEKAKQNNVKIFLPADMLCGKDFKNDTETKYVPFDEQEKGWIAMGIGPKTVETYKKELADCKTVIWNGPVSVFEFENFAKETFEIAETIADYTKNNDLISIAGGGDTAAALKACGMETKFSHVSTGGGASLELMEGKSLPGVESLTDE